MPVCLSCQRETLALHGNYQVLFMILDSGVRNSPNPDLFLPEGKYTRYLEDYFFLSPWLSPKVKFDVIHTPRSLNKLSLEVKGYK